MNASAAALTEACAGSDPKVAAARGRRNRAVIFRPKKEKHIKAAQFAEYGDPSVLKLVEVDEPHAGPGKVRVAVRAAGVNGIDGKIRAGQMGQMMAIDLPAGSRIDAAGVVDEVGDGVEGVAVGDAVFGSGSATHAEHAVLDS